MTSRAAAAMLALVLVAGCAGEEAFDPTTNPDYVRGRAEATGLRDGQPIALRPYQVVPDSVEVELGLGSAYQNGIRDGRIATGCVPKDDIFFEPEIQTPAYADYVDCLVAAR